MKKSPEEKREERIIRIAELIKQREAINTELNFLTGVSDATNTKMEQATIPEGFSYTREVERLFDEHPQLRILQATAMFKDKFPTYNIERRKVHSSLVYLAKAGKIKKDATERGLFSKVDGA